jgi:hypothetical protein
MAIFFKHTQHKSHIITESLGTCARRMLHCAESQKDTFVQVLCHLLPLHLQFQTSPPGQSPGTINLLGFPSHSNRREMHPAVSCCNNTTLEQVGVTLNNAIAPFGRSTLVNRVTCGGQLRLHSTNTTLRKMSILDG